MLYSIIVGGIAGLIGSKITGNDAEMGWIANIIVGILGGILGNLLLPMLGLAGKTQGEFLYNILVSLIGSILILAIWNFIKKSSKKR